MASPSDDEFYLSASCADLPAVPARHKKVLDKLARCSYCGRLCCCIEHRLNHENKHPVTDREEKGGNYSNMHEWIDASEMVLSSGVVRNEFPFFCVYCKIKVKDEVDLRHVMVHRPTCPIKKCHWMIPLALYQKENKDDENKENRIVNDERDSLHCPRFTPKRTPEKSLLRRALRNCLNLSLQTPPPPGTYEDPMERIGPLTSTPESDNVSNASLETAVALTTPDQPLTPTGDQSTKERAEILSTALRNKNYSKGTTNRRVTFACNNEESAYGIQRNENRNDCTDNGKNAGEMKLDDQKCDNKISIEKDNKENLPLKRRNNWEASLSTR